MARKAFKATVALVLLFLTLAFLSALSISGCGNNANGQKDEDKYTVGQPNAIFTIPPERTESWTPDAQAVAQKFRENDYPGALNVLYQSILNADSNQEDLFFLYADQLGFFFYDPETAFRIYKYSDRSNWSDEEKAAADMLIAIASSFCDSANYHPEGLPSTEKAMYEDIIANYSNTRAAAIAKMKLALCYVMEKSPTELVIALRNEFEESYPNSCYLADMQDAVASSYYRSGDLNSALSEYERVLELPDFVTTYSTLDEYATIHDVARMNIKEIGEKLGSKLNN